MFYYLMNNGIIKDTKFIDCYYYYHLNGHH